MIVNKVIDCPHEFVAGFGCTIPVLIPEIRCNQDIWMVKYLIEIN
jgi:hypothetical protein